MKKIILICALCFVCLGLYSQTGKGKLHLFDDFMKTESSPYVYDFLERYLYHASHSARGYDFYRNMADDKVVIRDGNFDNIPKLGSNVSFTLTRFEDKGYDACWKDTVGHILLEMQFPIQFELLLGQSKAEIEREMRKELETYSDKFLAISYSPDFIKMEDGLYKSASDDHYYIESLNTASYYIEKDGEKVPIYSSMEKGLSAANLFMGIIEDVDAYRLYIQQNLYGYKQESYSIKLAQWLNYCKEQKLKVYFGIEEERKDGLKALLIAHNPDLGYNHMMSIIIPDTFIEKRNAVLKATFNAYIPTDNVKDLYQQDQKKGKKK